MPSDFDSLDAELAEIDDKAGTSAKKSSKLLPAIVAFIALLSFAVIVVYAYNQGVQEGSEDAAPVLRSEGPSKVPPQSPGGLDVPHQDKLVYNQIGKQQVGEAVERLLPPPETPLPKPTARVAPPPAVVPAPPPKLAAPATSTSDEQTASAPPPPVPPAAPAPAAPVPEAPKAAAPPARLATQPQQTATQPAAAVKPTELARAPSPQTVAKSAFRIQIASMTNPEAANIEWSRRVEQHKDILGGLTLVVDRADLGSRGIFFRVQAGPLPSRAVASALCDKLKQRKVGCLVVQP
jgi:hypothetical protein